MKKTASKTIFRCRDCGHSSPKWFGKCPECGAWNSGQEEQVSSGAKSYLESSLGGSAAQVTQLDQISIEKVQRYRTGIEEFDRITGGGIMPSSILLLGGAPGIGKSTLMLQVAGLLPDSNAGGGRPLKLLYVSGEESLEQIKTRAERLKIKTSGTLYFLSEVNFENIIAAIKKVEPDVLIIDSIQTVYMPEVAGIPGSVGQIRECASGFMRLAKNNKITVFLLGHVTKGGDIAGPMILEHIVDTVLYFDTEESHTYRILRAYKNRFGPTSELGVFEMKSEGLIEVPNPSEFFLGERIKDTPGTIVVSTIEGTRPLLLEVQALTAKTNFGMPRRMVTGLDYNKTVLLVAILEKKLGLPLDSHDVFVNVAGGLKITEPGIDLGVCAAIYSAFTARAFPYDTAFIGEVGLTGEVRAVGYIQERVKEAEKLGFAKIYIPKSNLKSLEYKGKSTIVPAGNLIDVVGTLT